jgi:hypothetical protein
LAVVVAAVLATTACSSTSGAPVQTSSVPATTAVSPATSPSDAAKRYFVAFIKSDQASLRALTCRTGWVGTHGIQLGRPAGRYTVHTSTRRVYGGWDVIVSLRETTLSGASPAFRIVKAGNRYLVCGVDA